MNNPKQLTFPWSKSNKSNFNEYYFDDPNFKLKKILQENDDIFIYGINKTGKTYLLQSLCNKYAEEGKTSLYIPLIEASSLDTAILDSIENMDLICIDDLDSIQNFRSWELAIFNLINNCLISGCRLVFSSSNNISDVKFTLKDLESRIKKIDQIEVFPIRSENISRALIQISNHRSINLGDRELSYLMTYSERSISNLVKILNKLDALSLEKKRKITIPLIKELT